MQRSPIFFQRLPTSPLRAVEIGLAVLVPTSVVAFALLTVLAPGVDTGAVVWTGLIASLVLATIVVFQTCRGTIGVLRSGMERDAVTAVGGFVRVVESVLAVVVLGALGTVVWLGVNVPMGRGAGSVLVGLFLIAATASILLALLVLAHATGSVLVERGR